MNLLNLYIIRNNCLKYRSILLLCLFMRRVVKADLDKYRGISLLPTKRKVVPLLLLRHTPLIFNLGIKLRWVVNCTTRPLCHRGGSLFPISRKADGPHSRSGRTGEENICCPCRDASPWSLYRLHSSGCCCQLHTQGFLEFLCKG
jgi:hypothetical protein